MSGLDKLIAVVTFLAVLSQAVQKTVDLIKLKNPELDVTNPEPKLEADRQFNLYRWCFGFGFLFSFLSGFTPQTFLSGNHPMFVDFTTLSGDVAPGVVGGLLLQAVVVGFAVCFGGNIWNDILGILREVKKGKETANALIYPTVLSMNPAQAKAGDLITIHGFGFGAGLGSVKVLFDGVLVPNAPTSWAPNEVRFVVPATIPGRTPSTPWPAGPTKVVVTLSVGELTGNPVELQVTP